MKFFPLLVGLGLFGGLMLVGGGASAMEKVSPQERPRGSDLRPEMQDQLWYLSKQVEAMGVLPGFAEYTQPVAWYESRFNPEAKWGDKPNSARGWLQLQPESAFNWRNDLTHLQNRPDLLFDPRWNVAMGADYVRRLIEFNTDKGQVVTMADLRRGHRYPNKTRARYRGTMPGNLREFKESIEIVGADPNLPSRQITVGNWPGVQAILDKLGAPSP